MTSKPRLILLVHTEEEFPWNAPFSRTYRSVGHISKLERYQSLFEKYDIPVAYALTYPVLENKTAVKYLRQFKKQYNKVYFGIHCHPWVNPPYTEEISEINSYPGNLDRELEEAKITELYNIIKKQLECTPIFYLAGRYGIGENTYSILSDLNIAYDFSPVPYYNYSDQSGPDFSNITCRVYEKHGITVIPHSSGFTGWLCSGGEKPGILKSKTLVRYRLSSIFSILGGFSQVLLTPEGFSLSEMKSLTRALVRSNHETIVLSFHSPSIVSGNTPFVTSASEEENFYYKLDQYLDFYVNDLEGGFLTLPL